MDEPAPYVEFNDMGVIEMFFLLVFMAEFYFFYYTLSDDCILDLSVRFRPF